MSRFVAMFHKLAADSETTPPSPSDLSLASRILFHEGRRGPSSIDQPDGLRKILLRKKIIQRAHSTKDLDRRTSSCWTFPPPCPPPISPYASTMTQSDEAKSIAANNEALDRLFGDVFSSARPSDDTDLFCSKQAKIRKMELPQSYSVYWDSQLFLPVY